MGMFPGGVSLKQSGAVAPLGTGNLPRRFQSSRSDFGGSFYCLKMFSIWLGLILKVQLNGKSRQQRSSSISRGVLDPPSDRMLCREDFPSPC